MKINRAIVWIMLIIILIAMVAGCATRSPNPKYIEYENNARGGGGVNNLASQSNPAEVSRESANLRGQVTNIDGVQDATVVINNTRAIIGVTPEEQYKDNAAVLENRVQSSIERNAEGIREVYVTAEPSLFRQIRAVENNINNGNRPENYNRELNNIAETINANGGMTMEQQE
ncbi:MAG: hypothetical protein FH758_01955 [Firmicutes bacterium]|nr:hypothetical protein [Bacillota bacterium]